MKYLLTLMAICALTLSCSKDSANDDTGTKPSADMQKSSSIGWVGFYRYHMSLAKNNLGQAQMAIPIVVFDHAKLKTINLYISQGALLWSLANPKNGTYTITDALTEWGTNKSQTYYFEFELKDGSKLTLDNFSITLN